MHTDSVFCAISFVLWSGILCCRLNDLDNAQKRRKNGKCHSAIRRKLKGHSLLAVARETCVLWGRNALIWLVGPAALRSVVGGGQIMEPQGSVSVQVMGLPIKGWTLAWLMELSRKLHDRLPVDLHRSNSTDKCKRKDNKRKSIPPKHSISRWNSRKAFCKMSKFSCI